MSRYDELTSAKKNKNDEFYTQYNDIQVEVNAYLEYNPDAFRGKTVLLPCDDPEWSNFTKFFAQNFEMLGLKKLISTSYAADSKRKEYGFDEEYHQFTIFDITDFEAQDEKFDEDKTHARGKIFVLEKDTNNSGTIDIDDLEWSYLEGDGDFRSKEVKKLRDEADIIVTNPPFSLFREFFDWIREANKTFLIFGTIGAASYKEVFPLIRTNKVWLGCSIHSGDREFRVPDSYPLNAAGTRVDENGNKYIRVKGVRWFTNMDHGRRHEPLKSMTYEDNLKYSKHKDLIANGYIHYDNYDAIDVPYTDAIPGDYDGIMGVPITFLDKYNPDQYEILGLGAGDLAKELGIKKNYRGRTDLAIHIGDKNSCPYSRLLIRRKV